MGKVYRVTVTHPRPTARTVVKHGTKSMLTQTWAAYLKAHKSARWYVERCRYRDNPFYAHEAERYEDAIAHASFKVEVAPNAAFQDISASYDVDAALAARESLRTINHASG